MEYKNKEKSVNLESLLLIPFLVVYELSATIYSLPNNDILRWVVCFLLVGVDFILVLAYNNGRLRLLPNEFLFLVFPLFIQSFWNQEQMGVALSRSFSFLLYCMAIVSLFHRKYMTSEKITKLFYVFFGISILLVLPLNILNYNMFSASGDYIGIYTNRNMTTSVLLSIFVMLGSILQLRKGKKKVEKSIIIIMMLITVYLIFLTHSRMSIIGVAIAFFMLWYYSSTRTSGLRIILFGVLAVIFINILPLVGAKFGIVSIERIFTQSVANGSTGLFRNNIWETVINLVGQKPFFGWGNNAVYYNTFVNPVGSGWGVHNSYYVMLIEGGIAGTIFYFLFFLSSFSKCKKDYRECIALGIDHDSIILVRYCLITCVVLAINAFAESFLFSAGNILSLPFWFCLIGCRVFLQRKKRELMVREGIESAI